MERVRDVLTGTREFKSASEVADEAACSETAARRALEQLVEMGVAERRGGRPAGYRRNESFFEWRQVEKLARENEAEDLSQRFQELLEADMEFQERYGVPEPGMVKVGREDHESVHEELESVREWETIRRDLGILQRAIDRAQTVTRNDTRSEKGVSVF